MKNKKKKYYLKEIDYYLSVIPFKTKPSLMCVSNEKLYFIQFTDNTTTDFLKPKELYCYIRGYYEGLNKNL